MPLNTYITNPVACVNCCFTHVQVWAGTLAFQLIGGIFRTCASLDARRCLAQRLGHKERLDVTKRQMPNGCTQLATPKATRICWLCPPPPGTFTANPMLAHPNLRSHQAEKMMKQAHWVRQCNSIGFYSSSPRA